MLWARLNIVTGPLLLLAAAGAGMGVISQASAPLVQDKPKVPALTPAEQYKALDAESQKALREYSEAMRAAKTSEEAQKIYAEKNPVSRFVPRFMDLAEKNRKDAAAADALIWVVKFTAPLDIAADSPWMRAMDVLLRDHIDNEKLVICLRQLKFAHVKLTETYLRTAMEKSPRRMVQGQSCLTLAQYLADRLAMLRTLKAGPAMAKQYESRPGKEYVQALLTQDPDKMEKEIILLYGRVTKDYAELKTFDRDTLGDIAKRELFEIKCLAIGKIAPDIEGEDLDGQKFKLSDYRGKVVLLDFWGHW